MIPNNLLKMQTLQSIKSQANALFIGLVVLFFPDTVNSAPLASDIPWVQAKNKNGINISTRETASGYKAVKAAVSVKTTPLEFLALLENIDIAPKWIDNCESIEVLASPSESERIVRTTFSAPWPVKDRDMITHSNTFIDPISGNMTITVVNHLSDYKSDEGKVRMSHVQGTWTLVLESDSNTLITYQGYGEPAGKIPIWLANKLVVSSLFKTFKNMRKHLEK